MRKKYRVSELVYGDDDVFVTNLYGSLLKVEPDRSGYLHYYYMVKDHPEMRLQAIRDVLSSDQGRIVGCEVDFDISEFSERDTAEVSATATQLLTLETRLDRLTKRYEALESMIAGGDPTHTSQAIDLILDRALAQFSRLESQVETLNARHTAIDIQLRHLHAIAAQAMQQTLQYSELAALQLRLEKAEGEADRQAQLIQYVKEGFECLHQYATSELKEGLVNYVTSVAAILSEQPLYLRSGDNWTAAAPLQSGAEYSAPTDFAEAIAAPIVRGKGRRPVKVLTKQ